GIVDQERNRTEGRLDALDGPRDRVIVGDIDDLQARARAAGLDFARDLLSGLAVEIENADRAAFLGQAARGRGADAVGAAGHDDGAVLQSTHVGSEITQIAPYPDRPSGLPASGWLRNSSPPPRSGSSRRSGRRRCRDCPSMWGARTSPRSRREWCR